MKLLTELLQSILEKFFGAKQPEIIRVPSVIVSKEETPEVVVDDPFKGIAWNVPNFSLKEVTRTDQRQFIEENRKITQEQADKLAQLCMMIMPVREKWGPVLPTSVYRCPPLNRKIGSTSRSQHPKCEAMDFEISGRRGGQSLYLVFDWIRNSSGIKFGQLIWELGEWIHISLGEPYFPASRCGEVLTYKKDPKTGKKYYEKAN